jgi:hypothetical protein
MPNAGVKPIRPWREIAALAAKEDDHEKAMELVQELIRALDAESNRRMDNVSAREKSPQERSA